MIQMWIAVLLLQEGPRGIFATPHTTGAEDTIITAVQWLKLAVETIGAVIIGLGIINAGYRFVRALIPPQVRSYNRVRLTWRAISHSLWSFNSALTSFRQQSLPV